METFDPTQFCTIEERIVEDKTIKVVTVDPHVMYPAIVERIRYCLANKIYLPPELIQVDRVFDDVKGRNRSIQITQRAEHLYNWAESLSDTAWDDALRHRQEFTFAVSYVAPSRRPSLALYVKSMRTDIERLWQRGDALEVVTGWRSQAMRLKLGAHKAHILNGLSDTEVNQQEALKLDHKKRMVDAKAQGQSFDEPEPVFFNHYQL